MRRYTVGPHTKTDLKVHLVWIPKYRKRALTGLPPEQKRSVLMTLAEEARTRREERLDYAEAQLRRLCVERGLDWDAMNEDEREAFIDDLVHEDRV